jgi:hypothetical protein
MAKRLKGTQNEAVGTAAEPSKVDASITNEELAQRVIEGVQSAKLTAEDMPELRERFAKLKKTENIVGYRRNQWEKFCKEKLGMSAQTARRWIRETCKAIGTPTPGSKHDGSKNRSGALPPWTAKTPDGTVVDVARSAAQKDTALLPSHASSSTAAIHRFLMTTLGIYHDSTRARKKRWRSWVSNPSTTCPMTSN